MTAGYLAALGLTLVIEIPLALWVLRGAGWRRILVAVLVGNLLTHPAIHFGLFRLGMSPPAFEAVAEALAFGVEAGIYWAVCRPPSAWDAVLASALANGVSYGVGLIAVG